MAISIENTSNERCDEVALESVIRSAFMRLALDSDCDLSISIVTLDEMRELNSRWMDEDGPTDVLSFPMDEVSLGEHGPAILGDIVLCPAYAKKGAAKVGSTLDEELQLLVIHGLLHLLGLDHRESDEEAAMFALQGEILREWRSQP
jgi:probable rRNA maturation factor